MKILVVEDDTNKLRHIVGALTEVDGVALEDIEHASDAAGAKRFLRDQNVDLIVLDLHLPDRIDLPPQPSGGLEFVRSIATRPSFFVPTHVVAISGNPEALAVSGEDAGELWGVIRYDATSELWRDQLKTRVRYALAAWKSMVGRPRETRRCDVAILTALDDELGGVLRLPLHWREYRPEGDGTIYYEADLTDGGKPLRLVAATASRMGMAACAALASKVIDTYRPRHLAMAGVTGGIRGRVQLGDLLVADPSWDWGSGKYEVVNGRPRFAANPDQLRLSADIRSLLIESTRDAALLATIRSSFPGPKPQHPIEAHVEAVASGASVLGDEKVVEAIKEQHRKLHGVEMEIYGLMMAAETCSRPRPIAFGAKAVSDFADTTKNDDLRAYAIHVSANFILNFIATHLRRRTLTPAR
jgi:nucleoside phosphorylase/CheY-like chemotaxis protein